MVKPIVYHSFEEKELLERKLLASTSSEVRSDKSRALMSIFYTAGKKSARRVVTKLRRAR